jgi:hypothetical protein
MREGAETGSDFADYIARPKALAGILAEDDRCPASAPLGQTRGVEERRISGSS